MASNMTTINELLWKYQKIEALFLTPEIAAFKAELVKFRDEQKRMIYALEASPSSRPCVALLRDIIGSE
jgi:hypothetical protein